MAEPSQSRARTARRQGASRLRADDDERTYGSDTGDVVRDVSRLAFAWTQAGAHAVFDTVGIVNNLAADVTDSLIESLAPARYDEEDEEEDDRRRSSRRRRPVARQVNQSLSRALRDAADVLARTSDDFRSAYDDQVTDSDDDDATIASRRRSGAGPRAAGTDAPTASKA